jgi:hypothetical protein
MKDPDVDAYGQLKAAPLSVYEEARVEVSCKKRKQLLTRMSHLRHRLSGVEDILRTVTPAEVQELEASLVRIQQEIDMKKKLLQNSRSEKKEVLQLLREYEQFRAPLNIR